MEIKLAKNMGFCFGVKRAIRIARQVRRETKEKVWTLGHIIHNPQVVRKLEEEGIIAVDDLSEIDTGYVIIRSHGVHPDILKRIRERNLKEVDATCPLVKKAQERAKQLISEGYETYVIGERAHPEVISIVGETEGKVRVIDSADDLKIKNSKVGLVVQTTQSQDNLNKVVDYLLPRILEIKVFNTICDVTSKRQKEVKKLAKKSDVVIVVGGKRSANTSRLAGIAREEGCVTYHIEEASEIKNKWFTDVERVSIASGASTPDWIIKGVIKKLKEIDANKEEVLHERRVKFCN
ncbi:4-hydroxy-3-methylbut-2-enyl diphosphate reductase [candidate division WOR-3 bacterium]|nr:4-hydroxy-3-methylbut-2-enyl diphosphate reductase [candidate division WOR-3 bacterium]